MDLASKATAIRKQVRQSPWKGYEHVRGYAVMMLPFSSGHLLGLRVWPESDFAPYVSVWHRPPGGRWSIFNDGPSLDTTCPRWWGPALEHAELTEVDVRWTGANDLEVKMDKPKLTWVMSMTAPSILQTINRVSSKLPLWTWKPATLVKLREWMASNFLDMGDLSFTFTTPTGHDTIVMANQTYFIKSSKAVWRGRDLGHPVKLNENPSIADVLLPNAPTFLIGQAYSRIIDPEEYQKTRQRYAKDHN